MMRRMSLPEPHPAPFDRTRVRAITLDLDDTLWPVWPTIHRAEATLQAWLRTHAPRTAALAADADEAARARRAAHAAHPQAAHDVSLLRREAIRYLLERAGDDGALAEPAFEVFYQARQRVELFADALPALRWLAARWPLVALTNGNADVGLIGLGAYFVASVSARQTGVGKPDARLFQAGAAAAGVPPEAVLHVGDDAPLDGGALAAGMQMAWVNRAGHAWPPELPPPSLQVSELQALCQRLGG